MLWNFRAARQSQSYSYHDTLVSGYSHTMIGPSPESTADTPPPPVSPGPFLNERVAQVRDVQVGRALVGTRPRLKHRQGYFEFARFTFAF